MGAKVPSTLKYDVVKNRYLSYQIHQVTELGKYLLINDGIYIRGSYLLIDKQYRLKTKLKMDCDMYFVVHYKKYIICKIGRYIYKINMINGRII
jgi:hypothetical protein